MTPATKSATAINWVHPSVRDLVIDHLSQHDAARARFLETAGVAGMLLAMSTAGGATGERRYPLLSTPNDSETLRRRLLTLAEQEEQHGQLALLRGLTAALSEEATGDPTMFGNLCKLAETALHAIRTSLDRKTIVIDAAFLGAYYTTSTAARVLAASPDLRHSWQSTRRRARAAVISSSMAGGALAPVRDWLELAVVLHDNEPRFLRIVGFPYAVTPLLDKLQSWLERGVVEAAEVDPYETEEVDVDDEHTMEAPVEPDWDEDEERQWMELAATVAAAFAHVVPALGQQLLSLSERAQEHAASRERRRERYDEWRAEFEGPDYSDDYRPTGPEFDIADFFSDL